MPVTLIIDNETVSATRDATVFELAERVDVRVPTSCHRQGKCRECLVELLEGGEHLSPMTPEEAHLNDGFRLSCRTRIAAEHGVVRCRTLKRNDIRIETSAFSLPVNDAAMAHDPAVTRSGQHVLLDGEVIDESNAPLFGIAVDLGTTTVAMRLVNLETGQLVATQSFENPQRFGGSDVMARIQFDSDHRGRLLQRVLLGYMNHAIETFPCNPLSIYEMVVAGNATMRDLFFGLDVSSIGQKPYHSITEQEMRAGKRASTSIQKTAKRLHLNIHPKARIYGLPLIGSHVGADAAACLLATDFGRDDRLVALMDLGTNTELIVGRKGKILCASCPAGPAFEGGQLSCGMPAVEGAIERVQIDDDGAVSTVVVGNTPPTGICGSGLIDALSELLRTDTMNALGRYTDDRDAFLVSQTPPVALLESDISELAQAKGANVAGLRIVLEQYGADFDDLDVLYFAGGFARHVSVEAARRIGLVPNIPADKIVQVGNASLEGTTCALCSVSAREALDTLVKTIEHVELETHPDFFEHFVEGCQFTTVDSHCI